MCCICVGESHPLPPTGGLQFDLRPLLPLTHPKGRGAACGPLRPRACGLEGLFFFELAALCACGLAALYLLAALKAGCGSSARGRPGSSRRGSREAGGLRLHRECRYCVHIDNETRRVVLGRSFCLETDNDLARVHVP